MTTGIKAWSITAASNNASPPNGAPEGWAPSTVNAVVRQIMAEVRSWYDDPAWIDYGYTYVYVATDQFKISSSNQTAKYAVGRRVRAQGTTTGTIYGTISVSAYSTDTTVTVVWDSGTLINETLTISVGQPSLGLPISNRHISNSETTIASDTTTDLGTATANVVSISGTTTITGFGSTAAVTSPVYFIRFTGVLTLTHNATSLILPGGANITTAAGDTAVIKYEGSGNWRCLLYSPASGQTVVPVTISAGLISAFGGTSAPSGYLACNGSAVSRTTYAALFAAIGTTWGAGDASTTFNLPSLNRRTLVGSGGSGTATIGNAVGNTGGEENHTLSTAELPAHSHFTIYSDTLTTGISPTNSNYVNRGSSGGLGNNDYTLQGTTNVPTVGLTSPTGSGTAHNIMQPSAIVLWCIKT